MQTPLTFTAAMNILAELLDELDNYASSARPDRVVWLEIHDLATQMCAQLNSDEAPETPDA